jgi:Cdc6-like AAA superfamily ATPase
MEVGANPKVAKDQMRHSDARITLDICSHAIGESQREAVDKVGEILRPSAPKSEKFGEYIQ